MGECSIENADIDFYSFFFRLLLFRLANQLLFFRQVLFVIVMEHFTIEQRVLAVMMNYKIRLRVVRKLREILGRRVAPNKSTYYYNS